jgi:hypothetical protein
MRLTVAEAVWRGGSDAAKVPVPVLPSQDSRLPKSGFFGSGQHNQLRPFTQPICRGVDSAIRPSPECGTVELDTAAWKVVWQRSCDAWISAHLSNTKDELYVHHPIGGQ